MMQPSSLYARFHQAILNPGDAAILPDIRDAGSLTPGQRMSIYRDAYRLRLMQALRDDYPALAAYLGTSFNTLAAQFIETHPPTHYNLDMYGFDFATYVARDNGDVFAADLAQLEGVIAEAYLAVDSDVLTPHDLIHLSPEEFAEQTFKPRPSLRLLALAYPARAWLEQQRQGVHATAPQPQKEHLALVRHNNEVQTHRLSEIEFSLLEFVIGNETIGAALTLFAQSHPQHSDAVATLFQQWLGLWIAAGFFAR